MPNEPISGPTALQQLEAALAAGHLTPEVFAALRAQLPATTAPPAPKETTFSPSGTDEELPSLLDMFTKPPTAPASPPPALPEPPAARPAPASPPHVAADADAAARRLIEERLAHIRQRPAVAPPAPPAPSFYPEPPAYSPPAPPTPTPIFYPEPTAYSPEPEPESYPIRQPAATPPPQRPAAAPKQPEPAASGRGRWPIVLLVVLAVVGALAYFLTNSSHPDETLSSPASATASAPTETAAPKAPKRTKKSPKKKRKPKRTTLPTAAPVATEAPADEPATVAEEEPAAVAEAPAAVARRSPPAAPEADDDAATIKIRTVMAAYYADLFAPPLHASQYFAPQVERLYIQQNLTPAAIDAELARSFFPENQQAIARIEPGSLRVSSPAADGSHTATFTETMRLYRVSLSKNQQLRTQVRVRFNADNKIVYMRQEKLLTNTFE